MLPITKALLDNYNRPKKKLKAIKGIVIHWTANTKTGANAMRNRNYFNTKPFIKGRNGKKVYASAHYIVDDSSIVQCIPDNEVAYHVGARFKQYKPTALRIMNDPSVGKDSPNNYLIGIEMCVNSDGNFELTETNTIQLTQHLMGKHSLNIELLYRHYDITGKLCPKMYIEAAKWKGFTSKIRRPTYKTRKKDIQKGKVNTLALNIRQGPGRAHKIIGRLVSGFEINILERKGKWMRIGKDRWVHGAYVQVLSNGF